MTDPHINDTNIRPLIAVVGDASVKRGSTNYALAEGIGCCLVDSGYRVLTGGLGGVMEAACLGARRSDRYTPGDTVGIVPGHDPRDANPYVDIRIASGLDHGRNSIVGHADALVSIGGGAGTLTEICFAWMFKRLVIALRVEGWSGRIADQRIDERVRYPEIPDDRVFGADDAEAVQNLLRERLPLYVKSHHGVRRRD